MTDVNGGNAGDQGGPAAPLPPSEPSAGRKRCRRRRGSAGRVFVAVLELCILVGLLVAGLYYAVERGAFDDVLKRKAVTLLAAAAGAEDYTADVGATTIRFNKHAQLELDAKDVSLRPIRGTGEAFRTGHLKIALETFPLLSGRLSVASVIVDGTGINFDALPAMKTSGPFRIDSIPQRLDALFSMLDNFDRAVGKTDIRRLKLTGITFDLRAQQMRHAKVAIEDIAIEKGADGNIGISGAFSIDGEEGSLKAETKRNDAAINALSVDIQGLNLRPFLLQHSREGAPVIGLDGDLSVEIDARRSEAGKPGMLHMKTTLSDAAFWGEARSSKITKGVVSAHYDFTASKVEVEPSTLEFGETRVPFTAGFIDMDRLDRPEKDGIAIDLLIDNGHAAPGNLGEPPVDFSGKAFGILHPEKGELIAPDMLISSRSGVVGGSLTLKFGVPPAPGMAGDSPEISLGLFTDRVEANTIRALWPFWLGAKGRDWVYGNLFGGTITNGSLAIFMPAGRLPLYPEDEVVLNDSELKIKFDIQNSRVSIAGDIPPLRDTVAHFDMAGPRIQVGIQKATAYFPSGRTIDVEGGRFEIEDISRKPAVANTDIKLHADASALLELTTYRPISSLQDTGFRPADMSGNATVSLKARFALENLPGARPPEWTAGLQLDGVSIAKPLGGRTVADIKGQMKINPLSANLEADAKVDSVPLHISLVEPLSKASRQKRRRTVTGDMEAKTLAKLVPGIDDIVSGRIALTTELRDDGSQAVEAQLGKAKVVIPWAGWEKGSGIPASVSFETRADGERFQISHFNFSGDGFGATGNLTMDRNGLAIADLSQVKLAPTDDVAVKVVRNGGRYDITVSGKSADARGLLAQLKAPGSTDTPSVDFSVNANIGTVAGFNNEVLRNVDAAYTVKKGKPVAVKLTAVTGNDQAVVVKLGQDLGIARSIELTATDAGALARFADIYSNMRGGLLNVSVRKVSEGAWRGIVDIHDFQVLNEQKLQQIVSTRSGKNGKSLNEAVKRDIDVSSQKFSRGYGRILIDNDTVQVENGVLRGEEVGATFQGVLRDGKGQMNMTGTFMPAYGLNRLFAEVPIIGLFLGNGRDRGLIGITFRLAGPVDKPVLQINPLSIIAPGVFRSIFQFQ